MDRASFYTNASGPSTGGIRPGRSLGPSLEELAPRGFSGPHGNGAPGGPGRHPVLSDFAAKQPLPPILPREAGDRMYDGYARPQPRHAWDHMPRSGPTAQGAAGLVTPLGASRPARSPSPGLPSLGASGRHLSHLDLERAHYPPQMHMHMPVEQRAPPASRAVGFEENHVTAPIKRPRVSLACLACRNRKSRCDGNRPTCKTCAHMKIDCKWPEIDFRRAKSGDAARLRRKGAHAGGSGQEASPPSGVQAALGFADDNGRQLAPLRSNDATRPMARMPSPSMARSTGSMTDLAHGAYHPYARSSREALPPPYPERGDYTEGPWAYRSERRSGSPSERYLVSQSAGSEPRIFHRNASRPAGRDLAAPSHGDNSSDGYGADAQSGDRSPLQLPPMSSLRQQRPDFSGPQASSSRLEASRTRDIAAKLLALTRVDPLTHRHGLPQTSRSMATSAATQQHSAKHEAQRLDDVYAINWSDLGVPRSALTREFTDAMAGSMAHLEILDRNDDARKGRAPSREAVLHLFQTGASVGSTPAKVKRVSLVLQLPEEAWHSLMRKPTSQPMSLRDIDFDLMECVSAAATNTGESNLALLAGEAMMDRNSSSKPAVDKVDEVPQELIEALFEGDVPRPSILNPLIDEISEHLSGIYLFFDRHAIEQKIEEQNASPVLLNAICGLGARFARRSIVEGSTQRACAEAFSRKAHALFWQAVTYPTCDAINAGIMLAICEVGANRASSASTILAASSRMALELGLHRNPPLGSSMTEEERRSDEFLFWSVYSLDRIVSVMTGRPFALQDRDIDARMPPLSGPAKATAFAFLVDLIRISNNKLSETLFSSVTSRTPQEVEHIQAELLATIDADTRHWVNSLPSWLRFSPANLRRSAERGDSAIFCGVHLSYHCTFLWRYLVDTSISMGPHDLSRLRQAAYGIAEISELCLESEDIALVSLPMMSPAFFLAGCVLVAELEQLEDAEGSVSARREADSPSVSPYLGSPRRDESDAVVRAKAALQTCLDVLEKRAPFWADATGAMSILQSYRAQTNRRLAPEALAEMVEQLRYVAVLRDGAIPDTFADLREMDAAGPVVREIRDARQLAPFFPTLF